MRKYAVIVAGGEGRRAGGDLPKQFRKLLGIPLLWWSVRAFHTEDPSTEIAIVIHPGFFDDWDLLYADLPEEDRRIPVRIVCGGATRFHSVTNGMTGIPASEDAMVAVHDAARPMVSPGLIARGWETCRRHAAAVPAVPVIDSLRRLEGEGSVAVPRPEFVAVQTPQVFRADILKDACAQTERDDALFSDDASAVEATGRRVALFEGDPENIKVTRPFDFDIAALLLKKTH